MKELLLDNYVCLLVRFYLVNCFLLYMVNFFF